MRIENISNTQALLSVGALVLAAWALYRLVPGEPAPRRQEAFSPEEIASYDRALPKYLLTALTALAVASLHVAVKSLPPVYAWLSSAGRGGYLVRDIANTHLAIVVGGTVGVTGLTWYALPRIVGRPLRSAALAGLSFWCTLIGAGGFYLANVVDGVLAGRMERAGATWEQANAALGAGRALPVALSATVMGIGYWTFVANVVWTVAASRRLAHPTRDRHLAGFFVVGALGLLAGTVQGVIQVMPGPEGWLQAAGSAGDYIDPIAHAHVNLVTGTLSLLAGLSFWWSRDPERRERQRTGERRAFWVLTTGSVLFYLTFLTVGVAEGRRVVAGMPFRAAVEALGWRHVVPLAATGVLTLAGVWSVLAILLHRFRPPGGPSPSERLVVAGACALLLGTGQGLVQLVPAVKGWLEAAGPYGDAVANAHAQLNMLGGVMLILVGLALLRSRLLLGAPAPAWVATRVLRLVGGGVGLYYLSAMTLALVAGQAVQGAPWRLGNPVVTTIAPLGMAFAGILMAAGYAPAAAFAWRATAPGRHEAYLRVRAALGAGAQRRPVWAGHVAWPWFVVAEGTGALAGFPGLGWILSGRGGVGLPLALAGPAVAWGVVPMMVDATSGRLDRVAPAEAVAYLTVSALLSCVALAAALARQARRDPAPTSAVP